MTALRALQICHWAVSHESHFLTVMICCQTAGALLDQHCVDLAVAVAAVGPAAWTAARELLCAALPLAAGAPMQSRRPQHLRGMISRSILKAILLAFVNAFFWLCFQGHARPIK